MVNFLALLGWSPGGRPRAVHARRSWSTRFTLEGISGGNAVFNPEKLDWFNQQHIDAAAGRRARDAHRAAPPGRRPVARSASTGAIAPWLERVIELLKPRAKRLGQFVDDGRLFFVEDVDYDPAAVAKYLQRGRHAEHLLRRCRNGVRRRCRRSHATALEAALRALAAERGIKPAALIHATRVAVTGRAVSPGLFEVLELLGRERTHRRLASRSDPRYRCDCMTVHPKFTHAVLMSVGCDSAHELVSE